MDTSYVAPHVGAWIEILYAGFSSDRSAVAPHVGAWIEIYRKGRSGRLRGVAPHVGAWIEIYYHFSLTCQQPSHPTWVRGLK